MESIPDQSFTALSALHPSLIRAFEVPKAALTIEKAIKAQPSCRWRFHPKNPYCLLLDLDILRSANRNSGKGGTHRNILEFCEGFDIQARLELDETDRWGASSKSNIQHLAAPQDARRRTGFI